MDVKPRMRIISAAVDCFRDERLTADVFVRDPPTALRAKPGRGLAVAWAISWGGTNSAPMRLTRVGSCQKEQKTNDKFGLQGPGPNPHPRPSHGPFGIPPLALHVRAGWPKFRSARGAGCWG